MPSAGGGLRDGWRLRRAPQRAPSTRRSPAGAPRLAARSQQRSRTVRSTTFPERGAGLERRALRRAGPRGRLGPRAQHRAHAAAGIARGGGAALHAEQFGRVVPHDYAALNVFGSHAATKPPHLGVADEAHGVAARVVLEALGAANELFLAAIAPLLVGRRLAWRADR